MDFVRRNPPRNISGYSIHADALAETLLGMFRHRIRERNDLVICITSTIVSAINIDLTITANCCDNDNAASFDASLLSSLVLEEEKEENENENENTHALRVRIE